jgi:hypothetical protein
MTVRIVLALAAIALAPAPMMAAGHGPVFGATTPTLGKGGWSFDQAWMGRVGDGRDASDQMLRTMISFGVTEDLQISGSLPVPVQTTERMTTGRMMAMMSGHREVESIAAWRFHRQTIGEGGRFESTAYLGGTMPLEADRAGMRTSPSLYTSVASGYASRSHYFWVGGGYQRYGTDRGDRQGSITSYSVVYGYRPAVLRLDYPKPDLRFFVEAVGEVAGAGRHAGVDMPNDGHVVLIGPTALLLYKAYGVEGGVLFPAYQRGNAGQAMERLRFGVNVSYFFWLN